MFHKAWDAVLGVVVIAILLSIAATVYAGRLYIKPDLERKRAARLLEEADAEFRNGKIHIQLSPEIAVMEFGVARDKYKKAVEIIEVYGEGFYTPGDVSDFEKRINECDIWIGKSQQVIEEESE